MTTDTIRPWVRYPEHVESLIARIENDEKVRESVGFLSSRRADDRSMNVFQHIVSCIDASAAQARAARYRKLMLSADKLEAIAQAQHDQSVLEVCYREANALREEAHSLDVTDMRDIDTDVQELEGTSW